MNGEPKVETNEFRQFVEVFEWTQEWYVRAVTSGYVQHPYKPDAETSNRLTDYFYAGMSPKEAVDACFGIKQQAD